ncbi:ultraviolet-B receptor UVR8 isoform X2 [Prunus yedoensis var. nudiflora]|uniref:Ultraviolet-B receptor UVR8 isoform X2 n=1 Tax=Prunus yedoensis var. nudiflora TaxID=2094558 RepID=A0A314XP23_PRUYE|nr:ultraviolet-B receptor UVR8 isoform X2 [Prunus yedoensis var. nudiflora]
MAFMWFESLQATSMQWHLNLTKTPYTWGEGYCGALGHGDEIDKTTPELMNRLKATSLCRLP